jgi:hypothetical protein
MLKFSPGIKQFLLVFIFFLTTLGFSQTTTIYSENYEAGFGGWSFSSIGSGTGSWINGSNAAHSSGATGNYVYSQVYDKNSNNDNNTNYNNHTYIIATSPTINTTGYSNITFAFDIWYNTETNWDGMKVEYSLNNGATWSNLGSVNNANWYNDTDVDAFGNNVEGWSGNSGGWITRSISLSKENSGFDNNSQVKIRILFASDTYKTNVGVAFDNIIIKSDKYCFSYGNNTDGYKTGIRLVSFNTIDNATPIEDNDYSDFTSQSTTVTQGTSYNLTVKVNTDGNYAVRVVVWIDWNQDGDFNDNGEEINVGYAVNVSNGSTSLSPYSITIPAMANTGPTRMRVSAKYYSYPSSCETGFDGEVEDYTINVIEPITITTGTISPISYCEGSSLSIPYTISGTYNSGNVFTAQLSDATGSFASPVTIGTSTATNAGTISGTIPLGTATGSGYRIRVVSSNPVVIGSNNGTNITINALPDTPIIGSITQPTCTVAGSVDLNGLPSGNWTLIRTPGNIITTGSGTNKTISGLSPGTYTFSVNNAGSGLSAEYFNNMTLTGTPVLTRTDATVNFNWGSGNPGGAVNNNKFSARWTGQIQPLYSETYTFTTNSDDGIRLWVNGTQIINNWTDHAPTNNSGTISLVAGVKYDIVLEYYENGGGAVAKLSWSSASQANQIIPQTQLFPLGTGCTSSSSTNVVVNNPSTPTQPTAIDSQVCIGSTATLSASGAVSGEKYKWYDAETGGTLLKTSTNNTDNTYVTPVITVTTNYWVSVLNAGGCESAKTMVTANVITVNTWNGSISSDWNTDANWGCKVPSSTNNLDVLIPAGLSTYPTLSSGSTGYVENVEFQLGSTLNVVNNSLRVTKNIKLNGSIYLQAESQLLQDEGSVLDIASTGFIEIDQQGTSDNFKYNYWGSPVGKISTSQNNASYTIATVLRDGTDTNNIKNIDFGASYTYADGGATSPIKLSTYWMYKYANKTSSDYNAWEHLGKDGTLSVGEGFTLKGANTDQTEQNYTFVGKPNNGTIKLPLSAGGAYLIGNPYPCALDAKQFIRDNISTANGGNRSVDVINGTLYFWDHFGGGTHLLKSYEGGYAIYTLTGSVPAIAINTLVNSTGNSSTKVPQRFIPVAQGFFVEAAAGLTGTEYIQFNNGQRKYKTEQVNTSIFLKNSKKKISNKNSTDEDLFPKIFLEYNSPNGYQREILVGFINSATDSLDVGYDALLNETNEEDMYWKSGKNDMIIQAVKTLDDNRVLPIEIKTAITGVNKISIKSLENIPEGTEIFIKDNSTGETFNITSNPFEINLNAGTYSNRFALSFKTDASLSVFDTILDKELVVFMDNSNSEIKLINNSNIEINSINLYNYLGQQIKIWKTSLNQNRLSLPVKTASGVYIIRINTSKGTINKKIVIE